MLASERGETDGSTTTFMGLSQMFSAYLKDKRLNILVQFAVKNRDADMPDVPTVIELAKDPEAKEADLHPTGQQRRDRALVVHHAERAAGAARAAARRVCGHAGRSGIPRRGREASCLPLAPRSGEEMQNKKF